MNENCPHCGVSLQGEPIPEDQRGKWYGGATHYSRTIGYSRHDYVQFWICPDCGGTWNRWAEGHGHFARAEELRLNYRGPA